MNPHSFIDVRNVSVVFEQDREQVLAVDRLDVTIERGQFAAIVGPSGCGKSTLTRLVSGLMRPTTGQVSVDGRPVTRPIRGVGMAFQNPMLMPWRTTLRNVLLPLEVVPEHRARLRADRAGCLDDATRLLASVGLAGAEGRYPWQLSGGMQQRANLCRALIHHPSILILDEPFAALDSFTREGLWAAVQALWMDEGFTAMMVTHDLREALYLADVVYVMGGRPGQVIERQMVDLPRPRVLNEEFDAACLHQLHALRAAVARAQPEMMMSSQ